jgi:hypothetical protein
MTPADTTKPATEPVNGFHSVEQLGGELNSTDNKSLVDVQARILTQRFAIGYCLAAELALIVWGACPR